MKKKILSVLMATAMVLSLGACGSSDSGSGSGSDGKYTVGGKEHAISQHGFGRDSEF